MQDFEEFFRKIQIQKLEEAGSLVEVVVDDQPIQGRMIRNDQGTVEVVVGEMTDFITKTKVKRDFRQADVILDWMDRFMDNPDEEFPTMIPPYEPVYSGPRFETREIRSVDLQMIRVLGAKKSEESDPYIKMMREHANFSMEIVDPDEVKDVAEEEVPMHDTRLAFRGFVNERTYMGDEIHWRFNPFSVEGAAMISYCQVKSNTLQGQYHYLDKSYPFLCYIEESPLYVIHSDAWAKAIEGVIPSMTAFSLACTRPFWRVTDARPMANVTLPVDFFLVHPRAEHLPLYDISNELVYAPRGEEAQREEQEVYHNEEVDHEPFETRWELDWAVQEDDSRVIDPVTRRGKVEFTPVALYMARGSSQVYRQVAKQVVKTLGQKWYRRSKGNKKTRYYSGTDTRYIAEGEPPKDVQAPKFFYWEEGTPYDKILFYKVGFGMWLAHDNGRVFVDARGEEEKRYDITGMELDMPSIVMFQSSIPLYDGWCNKKGLVLIEQGLPLPYFIRAVKGMTAAQRYEAFSRRYGQGENVRSDD